MFIEVSSFQEVLIRGVPLYIYTLQAGTDRTGEVSGAYYMRYRNMTFNDALYIDNHVQDRDM